MALSLLHWDWQTELWALEAAVKGQIRNRGDDSTAIRGGRLYLRVVVSTTYFCRFCEVFLIVLDGVQGETLWGGESRARDHTHKREQKAGQAAVERTTGQQ